MGEFPRGAGERTDSVPLTDRTYRAGDFDDNGALTDRIEFARSIGAPEPRPQIRTLDLRDDRKRAKDSRKSQQQRRANRAKSEGGQGASPLSTRNTWKGSATDRNNYAKVPPVLPEGVENGDPSPPDTRGKRSQLASSPRLSWPVYRSQLADAFTAAGHPMTAAAVMRCGQFAQVWDCAECGLRNAAAIILVHCDSRACPQCAKLAAKRRVDRLVPAFMRVPSYHLARRDEALARLQRAVDDAIRARDYWAKHEHWDKSDRAEQRRKTARWKLERVKDKRWGFKLLTISPPWKPWDANELTIERIRERIADCYERFQRVWDRIECAGMSAAIVSVELSEGGHIHLHAALYSPYLVDDYIAKLAGCFVDIREVDSDPKNLQRMTVEESLARAIREVVKYTVKSPSPKHDFVLGNRRRVIAPELAVRWCIATKSVQLGKLFGLARDAMKAEQAAKTQEKEAVADNESRACCPQCKSPLLGFPRAMATRDLARELTEWEWRHRTRWRKRTDRDLRPDEVAAALRAAQTPIKRRTPEPAVLPAKLQAILDAQNAEIIARMLSRTLA